MKQLEGVNCSRKQQLKAKEDFCLFNDILYKKIGSGLKTRYCLVLPEKLLKEVLFEFHGSPLSGAHLGIRNSIERVTRCFWSEYLAENMENYVKTCLACQKAKSGRQPP